MKGFDWDFKIKLIYMTTVFTHSAPHFVSFSMEYHLPYPVSLRIRDNKETWFLPSLSGTLKASL